MRKHRKEQLNLLRKSTEQLCEFWGGKVRSRKIRRVKKSVKKVLKNMVVTGYRALTRIVPVKKGLVVFDSFMGKSYTGSVRAVYEWMTAHKPEKEFEPVWVFTREAERKGLPESPDCRIVTYGTIEYYKLMSRAAVWVFDTRHEGYLIKKKSQHYVQTWHGTPLKKLGVDIETFSMKGETDVVANDPAQSADEIKKKAIMNYRDRVASESRKWDVLISASPFTTDVFKRCFAYYNEVLECGYPRNDVLFADTETLKATDAVGESGQDPEADAADRPRKNILYAPTWRDDNYSGEGGWYGYDPKLDIEALEKALGDEYTLTVKLHYLVKCKKSTFPAGSIESGFLRVADKGEDMAGLLKKADLLITDYSSVMFDYALLDKPMFFYAYDLERYRDELRGWYFDFEKEAPGPISRDTEGLIADIRSMSMNPAESDKWREKRKEFKERFAAFEDGHASERVAEKIETWL